MNSLSTIHSLPLSLLQVILITTPTIMYLGFAMHKIARMDDVEYRPLHRAGKKSMPIVTRGAQRDYEEAEDNGEEDPMITEEIEVEKDKVKVTEGRVRDSFSTQTDSFHTCFALFIHTGYKVVTREITFYFTLKLCVDHTCPFSLTCPVACCP